MIKTYFQVFVNYKQDHWARLLLIAEFAYNNVKNASTSHTSFEVNCGFYPQVSYKEDVNPCFQSKLADKLVTKLKELMAVCRENLQYAQKF